MLTPHQDSQLIEDTLTEIIMLEYLLHNNHISLITNEYRTTYQSTGFVDINLLYAHRDKVLAEVKKVYVYLRDQCVIKQRQILDLIKEHRAILPADHVDIKFNDLTSCIDIFKETEYLYACYNKIIMRVRLYQIHMDCRGLTTPARGENIMMPNNLIPFNQKKH